MLALGLAAAVSSAAFAQEAPPAPPTEGASAPPSPPPRGKRLHGGKLKEQLKLTEAQEAAWKQFTDAMHPPAPPAPPAEREDWSKLTTPQRLERIQELADKRHAEMRRRHDAIRTFYGQLTPEQQKIFDAHHARRPPFGPGGPGRPGGPGKRDPRHGTPGGPAPRERK